MFNITIYRAAGRMNRTNGVGIGGNLGNENNCSNIHAPSTIQIFCNFLQLILLYEMNTMLQKISGYSRSMICSIYNTHIRDVFTNTWNWIRHKKLVIDYK